VSGPVRHLELRCRGCSWKELCGPGAMAAWLQKAGKLRAGREPPELGILYELFRAAAFELTCPRCGKLGLAVGAAAEETAAWPGGRLCRGCGKPIPRERLEAVPNALRCAACQQDEERGRAKDEVAFCPRCGAVMEVRVEQSGSRTRYVLGCSANPPCPL